MEPGFASQLVPDHQVRPHSRLRGALQLHHKRSRHPQSGEALALSPQSKVWPHPGGSGRRELPGPPHLGASADADMSHYEIRTSISGSTYGVETETTLGQVTKDAAALEFLTAAGLATPGASARFRIYVVLTSGNAAAKP